MSIGKIREKILNVLWRTKAIRRKKKVNDAHHELKLNCDNMWGHNYPLADGDEDFVLHCEGIKNLQMDQYKGYKDLGYENFTDFVLSCGLTIRAESFKKVITITFARVEILWTNEKSFLVLNGSAIDFEAVEK